MIKFPLDSSLIKQFGTLQVLRPPKIKSNHLEAVCVVMMSETSSRLSTKLAEYTDSNNQTPDSESDAASIGWVEISTCYGNTISHALGTQACVYFGNGISTDRCMQVVKAILGESSCLLFSSAWVSFFEKFGLTRYFTGW